MSATTSPIAKLAVIVERAREFRPGKPVTITDPDDREAVGPLAVAALESGKSQREVGEAIGVSLSLVGRWAREERLRRGDELPKRRPRNGVKSIRPEDQARAEALLADLRGDLSAVESAAVEAVTERAGLLLEGRALGIVNERLARALGVPVRSVREMIQTAESAGVTVPAYDAPSTARAKLDAQLRGDQILGQLRVVHAPYAWAVERRGQDAFALNALGMTTAKIGEALGVAQPVVSTWVIAGREARPGPTDLPNRQPEAGPWLVPWIATTVADADPDEDTVLLERDGDASPDPDDITIDDEARIETLVEEMAETTANLEWVKTWRRALVLEAGAAQAPAKDIAAAAGIATRSVTALLSTSIRHSGAERSAAAVAEAKAEAMDALRRAHDKVEVAREAQIDAWLAVDASEYSSAELEEHLALAGDAVRTRIRRARAARDLPGMRMHRPSAAADLDEDAMTARAQRAVDLSTEVRTADAELDVAIEDRWQAAYAAYVAGATRGAIANVLGVTVSAVGSRIRTARQPSTADDNVGAPSIPREAAVVLDELATTAARIAVLSMRQRMLAAEGRELGMTYAAIATPMGLSLGTVAGWSTTTRPATESDRLQASATSGDVQTHTAALQRATADVVEAVRHRNHRVLLASEFGMSFEVIGRVLGSSAAAAEAWARGAAASTEFPRALK